MFSLTVGLPELSTFRELVKRAVETILLLRVEEDLLDVLALVRREVESGPLAVDEVVVLLREVDVVVEVLLEREVDFVIVVDVLVEVDVVDVLLEVVVVVVVVVAGSVNL